MILTEVTRYTCSSEAVNNLISSNSSANSKAAGISVSVSPVVSVTRSVLNAAAYVSSRAQTTHCCQTTSHKVADVPQPTHTNRVLIAG